MRYASDSFQAPTRAPTKRPTMAPTMWPTRAPTRSPTKAPIPATKAPTMMPTKAPTMAPTRSPTQRPTMTPTKWPTRAPTKAPVPVTKAPTMSPTKVPTGQPIRAPTRSPTQRPTMTPTKAPTRAPTKSPTKAPTPTTCGTSVRRAWHDTNCTARTDFLAAVELLYKLPSTNSLNIPTYMDFVRMHSNAKNNYAAHGSWDGPFLHWHRWYLWKFEQALQYVSGKCLTVPYWDWTKDAVNPYQATVLQPDTFGSTNINRADQCVIDGIASKNGFWTSTASGDPCVKR